MGKQIIELTKQYPDTSIWIPFEKGTVAWNGAQVARIVVTDSLHRCYLDRAVKVGQVVRFSVRGAAGMHAVTALDPDGQVLACGMFRLKPHTRLSCNSGPYAEMAERIKNLLEKNAENRTLIINGRPYRMLVTWGRDHVHTLKAQKYFMSDVTSGLDYWLDTQEENGMVWDCIHPNPNYPARSIFGEALGERFNRYEDNMKYVVRRIPIEADCEFLYTEGVWYAWKASGNDAWMAKQLPRLEKALTYNSSHPDRWSRTHKLVRRSFCMDSWDFANPYYCDGDHRCLHPGDPQFLFHSDNSGLYASYWRMAEMYEHLGNMKRAKQLRAEGEALRKRANDKLFFKTNYGHMIPEALPSREVYAQVGDERKRMSLSTGYTINRKMPTHRMALKILDEYRRRGKRKRAESFAEWWTMDPPYTREQWPSNGPPWGEYMNGAICTIIAGEIAKAAFDHGREEYGTDIIERVYALSQRDGGALHQVYRRLPEKPTFPKAVFHPLDLSAVVNRGLKNGAHAQVEAWTSEGDNDMRNLPVGKRTFGIIEFDIIDPSKNDGRAVLRLSPGGDQGPRTVTVPVAGLKGQSIYFMHTAAFAAAKHAVVATYEVRYADGAVEKIFIRNDKEIGPWWGIGSDSSVRSFNERTTRVAWRGENATWANVGMYLYGWNNPRPDTPVTAITLTAEPSARGLLLSAISVSDTVVAFEEAIRSYGLPDCWAQAAVFYAVAEGLAGIEDTGQGFDRVRVSPRWVSSKATKADIVLHYPASDGYCAYRYALDKKRRRITLDVAGSFGTLDMHCQLPEKAKVKRVLLGKKPLAFETCSVEQSNYVDFTLDGVPTSKIAIEF